MAGPRALLEKKGLASLQQLVAKLDINTHKLVTHRLKTGWYGKGKGLLQVLWERGYIDTERIKQYQIQKEDDDGQLIPELSLLHMMENALDFKNEVSQLEHVGRSLEVRVIITTEYHAEYAGEGVEYSRGFSKSFYRKHPLAMKKGKDKFIALVDKAISRDLITVDMVRKFSKRARGYMLAYKYKALRSDDIKKLGTTQILHTR